MADSSFEDKRKLRRFQISLPVRIRGENSSGIHFEELSRSIDVNGNGALFLLKQDLKRGTRLKVSLPLPRAMRKTALFKPVYQTVAVVVRIEASADSEVRRIAVRFRSESIKVLLRRAS